MAEEKDEDSPFNPLQPIIDYAQGSVRRVLSNAPVVRSVVTSDLFLYFIQGFGTGLVGMVSLYVRDVWFPRKPAGAEETGSRRYR
mmetsp:Transcript_23127/g.32325  ORF Transcript_23127/g.32325 Transcript_23127/m.32325 type:complete len:85 (+) Transcript_23127:190-444(+)